MDEAARRSQTAKIGPRVLTITPNFVGGFSVGVTINNCPKCIPLPAGVAVWDEDGELGERDLLVHGWYVLETDLNIFLQQVNPKDACSTDPTKTGRRLMAGQCLPFFVDMAKIDGVIVLHVCSEQALPSTLCGTAPRVFSAAAITEGLIRINRADTVLKMSETGDSATLMAPPVSAACGNPLPVPTT